MTELSRIVERFGESQILLLPAAFILAVLGYATIKRLLKLVLFLLVFAGAYAALLYYFG
jgi:hypothetical protein